MLKYPRSITCLLLSTFLAGSFITGCQSNTQTGALLGTGIGSGIGAIVGHQIGKGKEGALIGAGAGAVTGTLLGKTQDLKEERDNAIVHAKHERMAREYTEQALTNQDILNMSSKGLSDNIIISAMHARGGRFDTSGTAIVMLHENQVSERVIEAMLQYR